MAAKRFHGISLGCEQKSVSAPDASCNGNECTSCKGQSRHQTVKVMGDKSDSLVRVDGTHTRLSYHRRSESPISMGCHTRRRRCSGCASLALAVLVAVAAVAAPVRARRPKPSDITPGHNNSRNTSSAVAKESKQENGPPPLPTADGSDDRSQQAAEVAQQYHNARSHHGAAAAVKAQQQRPGQPTPRCVCAFDFGASA
jgi:hypothetical protein